MINRRSHPIRHLILCGVLLIVAVAVGTSIMVSNFRNRALADSERELKNTALILAEQLDRAFQAIELIQISVIERIQSLEISSSEDLDRRMSGQDVHQLLNDKISGLPYIDAITLINADGKLVNFSRFWPIPENNIADRDRFVALKSNPKLMVFIGEPVRNRATGTWTLHFARKLATPNGDFMGLVQGAVELAYFEKYFGSIALGNQSSITLYRSDGVLLARYPRIESAIGKIFLSAVNALGDSDSGTIRYAGKMEGKDRLLAAHRLAHYPMHISVAVDTDAALAGWQQETKILLSVGGLTAFAIAVMFFLIIRQLSQRHQLSKQRLALEKHRLDVAINNMPQGLAMFDANAQLVLCNERYLEMYRLSTEVARPGCTLLDLILHRKQTKTFSGDAQQYCSEVLSNIAKGTTTRRTVETADGRVIELVHRPMAGGGWVTTHEDNTERQRLLQAQHKAEELLQEQKLRLDTALGNMGQGLCMFDAEGKIVLCNPRYMAMMDLPEHELIGVSLLDVCKRRKEKGQFVGDPERFFADVLAAVRAGKTSTRVVVRSGGRAVRVVDQPMPNGGWVATFEDITEQRKIEQERDRDREFLNQIIDNVPTMIAVKDARERKFVLANRAAEKLWGISRTEAIGKTARQLFPPAQAELIDTHDEMALKSDLPLVLDSHSNMAISGDMRVVTSKRLAIRDKEGTPQFLISVVEDVTEFSRANARIAHLAHHDSLTDLPNRVLFREHLEQSLKWIGRGERLALLYLDIDEFKSVNDTLGHPVGDELLKAVAARLRACLRETDIIARLGGDEFAIIQTAINDTNDVIELANRIHQVIREPYDVAGHQIVTDTSIGIALAPHDGTDPDLLLKSADLAMYGAKADGRGTYRFFEPDMDARAKARHALEFDLREAIMCGAFDVHYQPLVNLRDNNVSGFEALVRWRHPQRGPISPAEFIPIAEETGLINQLGEFVLRTACTQAMTWPDNLKIAVNISPVQFKSGNLVQIVINALAASRLPARRLELEITEAVLIRDDAAVLAILHQLRNFGVRIALDDFGTGYSSLSYLQRFPFDKIKIDRSFIKDITEPDGSHSIVQAVVSIAKSRNIITTAEGVETETQLELLRALGCTEIQGYFFSPARPAAEIPSLLGPLHEKITAVA